MKWNTWNRELNMVKGTQWKRVPLTVKRITWQPPVPRRNAMLNVKGKCDMCIESALKKQRRKWKAFLLRAGETEKEVLHLNYDPDKTSTGRHLQGRTKAGHDTDKVKA
jgi:Cu(I)/Ag(I) efflux system membrane fusion protein